MGKKAEPKVSIVGERAFYFWMGCAAISVGVLLHLPMLVMAMLKTIARGNALWQRLQSENATVTELAKIEGMSVSYLTRVLRLAFLDPWIVEQIVAGCQPANLDARKLTLSGELPMRWSNQRAFAGFNGPS